MALRIIVGGSVVKWKMWENKLLSFVCGAWNLEKMCIAKSLEINEAREGQLQMKKKKNWNRVCELVVNISHFSSLGQHFPKTNRSWQLFTWNKTKVSIVCTLLLPRVVDASMTNGDTWRVQTARARTAGEMEAFLWPWLLSHKLACLIITSTGMKLLRD